MSQAKIMTSLGLDGSQFNANIDGAKQKVRGFNDHLNTTHLSLRKIESALGIHILVQISRDWNNIFFPSILYVLNKFIYF